MALTFHSISELQALGDDLLEEEEMPSYLKDTTALPDFVDEAPVDATTVSRVVAGYAVRVFRSDWIIKSHRTLRKPKLLDSSASLAARPAFEENFDNTGVNVFCIIGCIRPVPLTRFVPFADHLQKFIILSQRGLSLVRGSSPVQICLSSGRFERAKVELRSKRRRSQAVSQALGLDYIRNSRGDTISSKGPEHL